MKQILKVGLFLVSTMLLVGCAKDETQNKVIETNAYVQDKDSYVLENDKIKFTLDSSTTYFQVLDKTNDTTWESNPTDGAFDEYADAESKKYLQSTLLLEYCTDTGIRTTYNNFEFSIEKQLYSIEEGQDYIQVHYTIGDIKKEFTLPVAVPESRMNEFTVNMDAKQIKQINSYYRIYDINKLRATDNKSELLNTYPDLEKEKIYVIREGTQDYLLEKIQAIFVEAGYTAEDLAEDSARYSNESTNEKPLFNVTIKYLLEDGDLVVELPFENMDWRDSYPLTKVKVLPYLGAGHTTDEGYVLVPEGNGGIIDFNNGKNDQYAYYTEVYGWDDGIKREALVDENRTAFPVFGIAKNGKSVLCLLEDYSSLASIEADVSGRKHSYNYANATYTTLHAASVQVSAKSDKSVMVYEASKPEGVIKQRYRFIGSDDYASMAESYRDYLLEKYPNMSKNADTSTPVNITLIGAIDKVKQRFGFPVSMPIPLTTFNEAYSMVGELKDTGYKNLHIKYSGWMNGGLKQSTLDNIKLVSSLGSKSNLKKLIDYTKELDVSMYLEGMVGYTYDDGIVDGYAVNRDSSKYASREIVELYDFTPIWYGQMDWKDTYYLVKPQLAAKYMENLADFTKKVSSKGVAFSDVGYLVSGDYNPKNLTTREKVVNLQQETLEQIHNNGSDIMINYGNDYTLPYVDLITEMDLYGSNFQIIDYSVPFYSMAIHGLVNYTGTSINLSGNYKDIILKSAESGAGLSFTFMNEPTSVLQNTNYTYFYGSDYMKWKEEAFQIYKRYEEEFGHCFNQYITGHDFVDKGVSITTYEDGTTVYVNYNYEDYTNGNVTVAARDYKVVRR
jgi:hypothetical protein